MTKNIFDMPQEKAWCPGCGNFNIQSLLGEALMELNIQPTKVVFVSGIGQAAKLPQYMRGHMFNGLHGRALAAAMAIKASNPELNVIVNSGDGCTYGEGGNHFLAQMARNSNITVIAHNNMIYGLTKGQASPTSPKGLKTPVQVFGVTNEPYNPIAIALANGATFVARTFVGNREKTKEIFKKAITHKGFALVDVFVQCVSMNKLNTFKWYREHTYELPEDHDIHNKVKAFERALEKDPLPTGIFYVEEKPTFVDECIAYKKNKEPLYNRPLNKEMLQKVINSKKT